MQIVNGQQKIDPSLSALIGKLRHQREVQADESANLHVQLVIAQGRIRDLEAELAGLKAEGKNEAA